MATAKVLGIGTLPSTVPALKASFRELGLRFEWVNDEATLAAAIRARRPTGIVACLPIAFGEVGSFVTRLREAEGLPVVVVGPASDVVPVIAAFKAGARDYLVASKAEDIARGVLHAFDKATRVLPSGAVSVPVADTRASILGDSLIMRQLRGEILKIAQSEASTVLLQGESGTGKDLIARVIHAESARASAPYLAINCSAIPESLLESEFFGHDPGAFTDAREAKPGLFEIAHRGTVFLDEIAELTIGLQAKLLRFVEERKFKRLGSTKDIEVDLRVIAATNADLRTAVRERQFRGDLFFRLQIVPIVVPPLRKRREDIPILAEHFLAYYARRDRKHFEGFHPNAMERLMAHGWPGNIRELKNSIERVTLLEEGPLVLPEMLLLGDAVDDGEGVSRLEAIERKTTDHRVPSLRDLEVGALIDALERSGGNQSSAARLLGISRDALRYRIQKHHVQVAARARVEDSSEDRENGEVRL